MAPTLILRHRVAWTAVLADLRHVGVGRYRLADAMLISPSTVQRWEDGSEPSHSYGMALLEAHRRYCGDEKTQRRLSEATLVA